MMMRRDVLIADDVPAAIGPYSLGIKSGDLVFVSGTLGIDPQRGALVAGGIEAETRQALTNLSGILKSGGTSLENVVKTTVFMQDMGEFAKMNAVYAEFFPNEPPARSTVEVAALPKGAAVEIEAVAVVGGLLGD
ncbi:MAG: Rid family detoxifying hydrolase [Anaerolineales bacterium]|jgi:2-iminobutanoate/2-iminopropanoate deaminase